MHYIIPLIGTCIMPHMCTALRAGNLRRMLTQAKLKINDDYVKCVLGCSYMSHSLKMEVAAYTSRFLCIPALLGIHVQHVVIKSLFQINVKGVFG
jgi:hypothetical protein